MIVREYFPDVELSCRCGCGLLPPARSVDRLYALRLILGEPLCITSAARCWRHNLRVGGGAGSVHLPTDLRHGVSSVWGGGAFDIATDDFTGEQSARIRRVAEACGFRGFGFGGTFLHIDDGQRPRLTEWLY